MIEPLNVTGKQIKALFVNSRNTEERQAPTGRRVPLLSFQQTIRASCSEAGLGSGARAAVWTVTVAAVFRVVAGVVGSVAGAAALSAAFALRQPSVVPVAGVPGPAAAGVAVVAGLAERGACPAAAGTSGPASRFPCSAQTKGRPAEAR